jgi:hypothetical protein
MKMTLMTTQMKLTRTMMTAARAGAGVVVAAAMTRMTTDQAQRRI